MERNGIILVGTIPMLAAYYGGITKLMIWWVENDFSISAEEVSSCLQSLMFNIIPSKDI